MFTRYPTATSTPTSNLEKPNAIIAAGNKLAMSVVDPSLTRWFSDTKRSTRFDGLVPPSCSSPLSLFSKVYLFAASLLGGKFFAIIDWHLSLEQGNNSPNSRESLIAR